MACKLCHTYRVSGAMAYQDEAISRALMALWIKCCDFDPSKQLMQRKEEESRINELFHRFIFGMEPEPYVAKDPYSNFWMYCFTRVRGSVLDFFRSEKLIRKFVLKGILEELPREAIKKIQQRMFEGEDSASLASELGVPVEHIDLLKPSMLHCFRFVSLSQMLSDSTDGSYSDTRAACSRKDTFADLVTREKENPSIDERLASISLANRIKSDAGLDPQEQEVVDIYYSDYGYSPAEAAERTKSSRKEFERLLASAVAKMKAVASRHAVSF